jgi:cobalamin biosynthesis Mg chelatase CobN
MVRMDIVAGLKNAVDRGYSLGQAQQTLINSGYSQQEIQEASNYLTGGQTNVQQSQAQPTQSPGQPQTQQPQVQTQQPQVQTQQIQPKKPKKKFPLMLIFLVFILVVLVSFLVLSIIFKDDLIILFQDLFG